MRPVSLVCLIGLPGAGKSTLSDALLNSRCFSNYSYQPLEPIDDSLNKKFTTTATLAVAQEISDLKLSSGVEEISKKSTVGKSFMNKIYYVHVCYDSIVTLEDQEKIVKYAKSSVLNCGTNSDAGSETLLDETNLWKNSRKKVYNNVDEFLQESSKEDINSDRILFLGKKYNFRTNVSPDSNIGSADSIVILLDDNLYYRSMRREYYQLAGRHCVGFCEVLVECSLEEAIKRNDARGNKTRVPVDVIERMALKLERPNSDLYSWEEMNIVILSKQCDALDYVSTIDDGLESDNKLINHGTDSCNSENIKEEIRIPKRESKISTYDNNSLQFLHRLICKSLNEPVNTEDILRETERKLEVAVESKVICSKSVTHQADLILRSFVSETVKEKRKAQQANSAVSNLKNTVKIVNEVRQKILLDMKTGEMCLPNILREEYKPNTKSELHNILHNYYLAELQNRFS